MSLSTVTVPELSVVLTSDAVSVVEVGEGRVVRLPQTLGAGSLTALREALLSPRRGDLVLDGGAVEEAGEAALAVLVAGTWWAQETGTRLLWSAISDALAEELDSLAVAVRRL